MGRTLAVRGAGVAVAVLLRSATAAAAEPSANPLAVDPGADRAADELFHQGVVAYRGHDYQAARRAFEQSFELSPRGATMRNLGLAELDSGHPLEALRDFRRALTYPELTEERRAVIAKNIADAYAATGHLAVRAAETPTELRVDGVLSPPVDSVDAVVDVLPGPHEIRARFGLREAHATVDAPAGQLVAVDLAPAPAVEPEVSVRLAPRPRATMAPSAPTQRAGADGDHVSWWTTGHAVSVALFFGSAVGVGVGVGFQLQSQAAANDVNASRAQMAGACSVATASCITLRDQIDAVGRNRDISLVGYGVGAALGITGAVLLLFEGGRPQHPIESWRWRPTVSAGSVGWEARF